MRRVACRARSPRLMASIDLISRRMTSFSWREKCLNRCFFMTNSSRLASRYTTNASPKDPAPSCRRRVYPRSRRVGSCGALGNWVRSTIFRRIVRCFSWSPSAASCGLRFVQRRRAFELLRQPVFTGGTASARSQTWGLFQVHLHYPGRCRGECMHLVPYLARALYGLCLWYLL